MPRASSCFCANHLRPAITRATSWGQALSNKSLGNITALSKNNNVIESDGKDKRLEVKIDTDKGAFCNFTGVASITQVAGSFNQVVTQVGVNVR